MARVAQAELEQAVLDVVTAAPGGQISHNDLVAKLEAAGKSDAAKSILPMQQNKRLDALVYSVPGQKPELRYKLGGA